MLSTIYKIKKTVRFLENFLILMVLLSFMGATFYFFMESNLIK